HRGREDLQVDPVDGVGGERRLRCLGVRVPGDQRFAAGVLGAVDDDRSAGGGGELAHRQHQAAGGDRVAGTVGPDVAEGSDDGRIRACGLEVEVEIEWAGDGVGG